MATIKPLYKERIKTLVKEYNNFLDYSEKTYIKLQEYNSIIIEIQEDIEKITYDKNIEANNKYIQINEKLEYIEKVSENMLKLKNDVTDKQTKLNKDKLLLIETCLSDQKELTEKDIFQEIAKASK